MHNITSGMPFGAALEALKAGRRVARAGWNGKGLWLELQVPDANSKMTLPYAFLCYPMDAQNTPGSRVPWAPSQTDMLTNDWSVMGDVRETCGFMPPDVKGAVAHWSGLD
jgi:hypothetical protein